jgi:hypothetical protein
VKLLEKAKVAAEQAAAKAKEGVEDVQVRKDLHLAYVELGKKVAELVRAGEVEHPELAPLAARVDELRAKVDAGERAEPAAPPAEPDQSDSESP